MRLINNTYRCKRFSTSSFPRTFHLNEDIYGENYNNSNVKHKTEEENTNRSAGKWRAKCANYEIIKHPACTWVRKGRERERERKESSLMNNSYVCGSHVLDLLRYTGRQFHYLHLIIVSCAIRSEVRCTRVRKNRFDIVKSSDMIH